MTNDNEINLARKICQNASEEEKKRKRESHSDQDGEDAGKRARDSASAEADRGSPQAAVEAELHTSDQAGACNLDEVAQQTGEEADQAGQKTLPSPLVKEMKMALGGDLEEEDGMEEDIDLMPPPRAAALSEAPPPEAMATDALPPRTTDAMGAVLSVAAGGGGGEPGAPAEPTKQYLDVRDELRTHLEPPDAHEPAAPTWDAFPDHLGEGVRARLVALAALHLSAAGAERCTEAVRQLPANSNRILLGAATNCELYQERVVRALARKVGASLLVVDATSLHLDDAAHGDESSGGAGGREGWESATRYGGGSGYESSDDDFDDGMPDLIDADLPGKGAAGRPLPVRGVRAGRRGGLSGALGSRYASMTADKLREGAEEARERAATAHDEAEEALEKAEKAHEDHAAALAAREQASTARAEKALERAKAASADHAAAVAAVQATADGVSRKEATLKSMLKDIVEEKAASSVDPVAFEEAFEKCFSEMGISIAQYYVDNAALKRLADAVVAAATGLPSAATPDPGAATAPSAGNATGTAATAVETAMETVAPAAEAVESGTKAVAPQSAAPSAAKDALLAAVQQAEDAMAAETLASASRSAKAVQAPQGEPRRCLPADGGSRPSRFDPAGGAAPPSRPSAALSFKPGDRVRYMGRTNPRLVGSMDALQAAISRVESRGEGSHGRLRDILPTLVMRRSAAMAAMHSQAAKVQPEGGPPLSSRGRVLSASAENVEVLFDDPFPGGKGAAAGKREGCGYACPPAELAFTDDKDDAWGASFQALFDVVREQEAKGPVVLFIQSMDRLIRTNDADHFRKLGALLAVLPPRCLVFAAYCTRSLAREKSSGGPSGLSMLFGGGRGGGDPFGGMGDEMPSWMDRFGGGGGGGSGRGMSTRVRRTIKGNQLFKLLPNHVELHPPNAESEAKAWRKMLDDDIAAMRERSNRAALAKVLARCGVACPDLAAVQVTEVQLSKRDVEQLVGAAVAGQMMAAMEAAAPSAAAAAAAAAPSAEAEGKPGGEAVAMSVEAPTGAADAEPTALMLAAPHLVAAAVAVQKLRAEAAPVPERSALKDIQADQYEKQLLNEVIPPEEIAVAFGDIGALESVKTTLHEVVILPLQRPELFMRGALTKPTKGLLLFGPPGTGKTMLAKAVACESGAHFINVNMSAITSKWFGEGERLVRALFSLAHKLAPSVIFVDEIDSFLSKRTGGGHEHEALRKMKNEFMQHWDGLRTKASDRVLVLAATNRPMDLDEAVIRRMPRRIFVPLPDAANREKILSVILKGEEVDPGMDVGELAGKAEGYSGSDLKNLCIAAAYCPIREYLDREREVREKGGSSGGQKAAQPAQPSMRPITLRDFDSAMKQVTSSTHAESASMSELQRWNDQFGEGGSRRNEPLVYFT